jgi:hypothetical protein
MTRRDFIMLSTALRAAHARINDDQSLNNDNYERTAQLRGVRRAAAAIADAITKDNPTFDARRFLTDCGYGATAGPAYRPRDMDDHGQPVEERP